MLWGTVFEVGMKAASTLLKIMSGSRFEGTTHKSNVRFQMVLFLFGLAYCRLSYEVVKLVLLMWVGVFGVGMKTASTLLNIMSHGPVSRVEFTSRRCSFKWYYSCLDWLTVDGAMRG
jgi:hypothetical protein